MRVNPLNNNILMSKKWLGYLIFLAFVLAVTTPIELYEYRTYGPELEPFGWNIILLWLIIGTLMYWLIYFLRNRLWIWLIIITAWAIIFEFFINPHQPGPITAIIFGWFGLFGFLPWLVIKLIKKLKK